MRHVRWSSDYGYYLQLIAFVGWTSLPWLPFLPQPTLVLVRACVRMCAGRPVVNDPLDSVSAAAALGATSEDFAHAGLSRLFCDR
jgi:hypothetical protein